MRIWKEDGLTISIKDKNELQLMRESGRILGYILKEIETMIAPGVNCLDLEKRAAEIMKEKGVLPSFKGVPSSIKGNSPFPNVTCINVNNEVVHGIPKDYQLKDGDIITVDCGVIVEGFHTDSAIQKGVGTIDSASRKLLDTTEKALRKAIEKVKPGTRIQTISAIIEETAKKGNCTVIRDLTGHGIGKELHEDPHIPNFREKEPGPMLQTGMTIAIEPIFSLGSEEMILMKDGWTYITADGSRATQVEHTIAVTEKGFEILTVRPA